MLFQGEDIELVCKYDLEGDKLYSVKWYRLVKLLSGMSDLQKYPLNLYLFNEVEDIVVFPAWNVRKSYHFSFCFCTINVQVIFAENPCTARENNEFLNLNAGTAIKDAINF